MHYYSSSRPTVKSTWGRPKSYDGNMSTVIRGRFNYCGIDIVSRDPITHEEQRYEAWSPNAQHLVPCPGRRREISYSIGGGADVVHAVTTEPEGVSTMALSPKLSPVVKSSERSSRGEIRFLESLLSGKGGMSPRGSGPRPSKRVVFRGPSGGTFAPGYMQCRSDSTRWIPFRRLSSVRIIENCQCTPFYDVAWDE